MNLYIIATIFMVANGMLVVIPDVSVIFKEQIVILANAVINSMTEVMCIIKMLVVLKHIVLEMKVQKKRNHKVAKRGTQKCLKNMCLNLISLNIRTNYTTKRSKNQ